MTVAIAVAVLVAGGLYLVLQRGVVRLIFGAILISHAINLVLISAGGIFHRGEPLVGEDADPSRFADPLVQAFVLTAIVIFFAMSIFLFSLAVTGPAGRVLEQEAAGRDEDAEDSVPDVEPDVEPDVDPDAMRRGFPGSQSGGSRRRGEAARQERE